MLEKDSGHWISQRLSAILLVPLGLFSVYKMTSLIASNEGILAITYSPFSLFLIIIFAIVSLYHAQLGFDVIIDDYVNCNIKKHVMKGLIKFVNLSTIIFFVFALYSYFQKQEINIENNQISSQQEISIENNN
jgi:succinate dehydrogenase / fumarate reductase membrane anchor subunit